MKVNRTICNEHEWVVYSTAINKGWLMLQCVTCGLHGVVTDPTEEEWAKAFNAPTHPYGWTDCDRITQKSVGPLQVASTLGNTQVCQRTKAERLMAMTAILRNALEMLRMFVPSQIVTAALVTDDLRRTRSKSR